MTADHPADVASIVDDPLLRAWLLSFESGVRSPSFEVNDRWALALIPRSGVDAVPEALALAGEFARHLNATRRG